MPQKMEYTVLEFIQSAIRQARVQPLVLGGLSGTGGGEGGPPGGFVGQLPQSRVTYDTTEAATLFTPASGMSLVDNLNHIRYRIGQLETGSGVASPLTVEDWDGSPSVSNVNRIVFSGAVVTNQGYGRVLVVFSGGGGSSFSGTANSVVLTDGAGALTTMSWFKWGTLIAGTRHYIELGANIAGKETNAGRISYGGFGSDSFLYIVGAGTSGGNRWVRIYDKLETDLVKASIEIPSMTSAVVLGTNGSNVIIDNTATADARYAPAGMFGEGWVARTETWTRTGNFTFTMTGDFTNVYRKGVRVKYTDTAGGPDYGYIINAVHSAGTTTITLATNTDYAMAAGAITGTYISYQELPDGFPGWLNYTPTYSAAGAMTFTSVSTVFAKFKLTGRTVFWELRAVGTTGGTANTQIHVSLPINMANIGGNSLFVATCGDTAGDVGRGIFDATNHLATFAKIANVNWGLGANRTIIGQGFYEI